MNLLWRSIITHQLSSSLEGCIFFLSILRGVLFLIGINVAIAVSTFIFTGGPDIAAGFLTLDTGGPDIAAGFLIADTGGPDIATGDSVLLTGCNCLTGVNDTAFCCCGFAIESLVVIGLSNAVLGSSSSSVTSSS